MREITKLEALKYLVGFKGHRFETVKSELYDIFCLITESKEEQFSLYYLNNLIKGVRYLNSINIEPKELEYIERLKNNKHWKDYIELFNQDVDKLFKDVDYDYTPNLIKYDKYLQELIKSDNDLYINFLYYNIEELIKNINSKLNKKPSSFNLSTYHHLNNIILSTSKQVDEYYEERKRINPGFFERISDSYLM